jgi:lauroyl/myristoyl acyltransferase
MAAAVAALRNPPAPPRMPAASLRIRMKTSPSLRRLLPSRVVFKMAQRRGEAKWERSAEDRDRALAGMETIVAGTPRAHELTDLARAHLIEEVIDHTLFWQPWRPLSVDTQSKMRLREAIDQDRGLLLSLCHTGQYYRATASGVVPLGSVPYSVVGRSFYEKPTPDYAGRYLALFRKRLRTWLVLSDGSFPILRELLEQGEIVELYFDRPGPHETRFLGKTATLANGTARLAFETNSPVLPMRARRMGPGGCLDVGELLDPQDFTGIDELHDRLAALHEAWILEYPESMRDPRSFGWGEWATADSWIRPMSAGRPA